MRVEGNGPTSHRFYRQYHSVVLRIVPEKSEFANPKQKIIFSLICGQIKMDWYFGFVLVLYAGILWWLITLSEVLELTNGETHPQREKISDSEDLLEYLHDFS